MRPVSGAIRTVVCSEAGSDSTRTRLRHDAIADAMGPGVIPEYGETIGTPSLKREQHRVVTTGAPVFQIADAVVVLSLVRIQQSQNFPLGDVTRVCSGHVDRIVQLDLRSPKVNILVAKIIRGEKPVLSNLVLNAQIPLVNVCRFGVLSQIVISAVELERRRLREGRRKRIAPRVSRGVRSRWQCPRVRESRIGERGCAVPRRPCTVTVECPHRWQVCEYSIGRTHHHHAVASWIPCECNSRHEMEQAIEHILPVLRRKRVTRHDCSYRRQWIGRALVTGVVEVIGEIIVATLAIIG